MLKMKTIKPAVVWYPKACNVEFENALPRIGCRKMASRESPESIKDQGVIQLRLLEPPPRFQGCIFAEFAFVSCTLPLQPNLPQSTLVLSGSPAPKFWCHRRSPIEPGSFPRGRRCQANVKVSIPPGGGYCQIEPPALDMENSF